MLSNIAWLVRDHGVEREGEADLVIAHPERGFLAVEVKAGQIRRDSQGRWWAGVGQLDRSPFQQAADSHHSLVAKLKELPAWQAGLDPIAGHAVAFPNVDLASLDAEDPDGHRHRPGADPRQDAPGARPAAQPEAARVGRSLLRAVGHGVEARARASRASSS